MTPEEIALEKQSTYTLHGVNGDILTFLHENGQELAVRVTPHTAPDGRLILYEPWQKAPPGAYQRLFTERGYEWIFELPLLLEYSLIEGGYPTEPEALIARFFQSLHGTTFKNYPRQLFR
jgi:hypothetical protein